MASAFSDVPAFPSIALKLNAALTSQVNCGTHHSHPLRLEAITAIPFWVKTRDGALARQTLAKCLKILNFPRFQKHLNFVSLLQAPSSTQSKPIL
jgi:hypothetical protein